jgi:hypothetical protein
LYAGIATFGASYVGAFIYGASQNFEEGLGNLAVPLLGPWLAMGQGKINCKVPVSTDIEASSRDVSKCINTEVQSFAVLVGLGVGELVGGVLLAVGLLDKKHGWLRADLAGISLELEPATGPGMNGLVARGTF